MKFEGGFLDNQVIHFNESLNCLIGGKGTGKSTILEFIRYAFDNLSNDEEISKNELKHIKDVLGNGKISLAIETNSGDRYIIERIYDDDPQILRLNGEETDIDIGQFLNKIFLKLKRIARLSYWRLLVILRAN